MDPTASRLERQSQFLDYFFGRGSGERPKIEPTDFVEETFETQKFTLDGEIYGENSQENGEENRDNRKDFNSRECDGVENNNPYYIKDQGSATFDLRSENGRKRLASYRIGQPY